MDITPQSVATLATSSTTTQLGPVVVIGASGKTGRRVVDRLTSMGVDTQPVGRISGTPFVWEDEGTWDAALEGSSAAYVAYSPDLAAPGTDEVISRLAQRARAHGIDRAVLLSGRGEAGARAAEQAWFAELPRAAVVRCAWFMQNFSEGLLRDAVLSGGFGLPGPGSAVEPFVDLDDVADVAVSALTGAEYEGQVLELTGPALVSLDEAAETLSKEVGRPVGYVPSSVGQFAEQLALVGVPHEEGLWLGNLFEELLDGRNARLTDGVERVLGRPATSLPEWAARAAHDGAWS